MTRSVDEFPRLTLALGIVAEVFPRHSPQDHKKILLDLTGYPLFWPDPTKSPEENLRDQLGVVRSELAAGKSLRKLISEFTADLDAKPGRYIGEDREREEA